MDADLESERGRRMVGAGRGRGPARAARRSDHALRRAPAVVDDWVLLLVVLERWGMFNT